MSSLKRIQLIASPVSIHTASDVSFAITGNARTSHLYSWGSPNEGLLGRPCDETDFFKPQRVKFADSESFSVKLFEAGHQNAALLTPDNRLYVWGNNSKGQLGLNNLHSACEPKLNDSVPCETIEQIAIGSYFTLIVSASNEIMVAGKLPFCIQDSIDFITTFQSIAQFDSRVKITNVAASRFASVVIHPQEDGQLRELFLWGESPLGIMNELTPLSELIKQTSDPNESTYHRQMFDVEEIKNGQNFCLFVDAISGLTFQLGAETLGDPYQTDC